MRNPRIGQIHLNFQRHQTIIKLDQEIMGKLVHSRSKYTDKDRRRAVVEYCVSGNMLKVSEVTGIPDTTLATWKNKSPWWDEEVATVRDEISEQILAQNLQIATKAGERVLDCLKNGDEKLVWDKTKNEYVTKRVKPSAKDSMVISGISQDKAARGMGLPTQIHATTTEAQIKSFIDEFRKISQSYQEKQVRVVSTQ